MNILYVLQQSIYGNDGKWRSGDSNINMMSGILRELTKKTDWKFYILIAPIKDFGDIKSYDEIIKHDNIEFIPYDFPIDAFLMRQHFNIHEFDKMYKQLPKIDIVWNNIIEISRNIKTYLYQKSKDTKLISCCYWMDTPEINEEKVDKSISYQYRQFDGYECSDLCVFTCESTRQAFFNNAKEVFSNNKVESILEKSVIWDFGFSSSEADEFYANERFDKKTILFLNRLSGINYTHHIEFIDAVNELYKQRQDFQVIFTNPSGKYSTDELKSMITPLFIYKDKQLNRKEYFELLWKADISFHGFTLERYGGCSNVESIYCNNIPVMPKVFEYKYRGGEDYKFYVNENFDNLVEVLSNTLDEIDLNTIDINEMKNRNLNSSYEKISDLVIKNIKEINV